MKKYNIILICWVTDTIFSDFTNFQDFVLMNFFKIFKHSVQLWFWLSVQTNSSQSLKVALVCLMERSGRSQAGRWGLSCMAPPTRVNHKDFDCRRTLSCQNSKTQQEKKTTILFFDFWLAVTFQAGVSVASEALWRRSNSVKWKLKVSSSESGDDWQWI